MHNSNVCDRVTCNAECITNVPRLLEALGGVDVGEALLEERVAGVGDAVVVDVVAGGDDEVDVQLLPRQPHLCTDPYTHAGKIGINQEWISGHCNSLLHLCETN